MMATRALLALGSVLVVCALVELGLRIVDHAPLRGVIDGRELVVRPSAHPDRPYELIPNTRGRAWDTDVSVNAHGFRDREFLVGKPAGVDRIVVLGDSIAFGKELSIADTFPKQLEVLIDSPNRPVEVLNLAHSGYNTPQEVATLEDLGLRFSPDRIVVGYCLNDVWDVSPTAEYIERIVEYGASPLHRSRLVQLVRARVDRFRLDSATARRNEEAAFLESNRGRIADVSGDAVLLSKMAVLGASLADPLVDVPPYVRMYASRPYVGRLRRALERLQALQDEHGFGVVVAVVPYLLETPETKRVYRAVYGILEHEVSRLSFDHVDAYDRFASVGFASLRIRDDDGTHPNALGHRLIAAQLAEVLRPRVLVGEKLD